MNTEKKDGTNNVPPPTSDEDQDRVTADTVVTDGREGLERAKVLTRILTHRPSREDGS